MPRTTRSGSPRTRADYAETRTLRTWDQQSDPVPVATSRGIYVDITVTDGGGLNISWTAGKVHDNNGTILSILAGSGACTDDSVNYLKWVSGTSLTLNTTAPGNTEIPVGTIVCQGTDIWELHQEATLSTLLADIQHGLSELAPTAVAEGLIVSEDADAANPLDVSLSAGEYYRDGHRELDISAILSRVTAMRRWYHVAAAWTSDTDAEIDNTQYDDMTQLQAMGVNKWFKSVWFVTPDPDVLHWIYPQEQFNTEAQAIAGDLPAMPPGLATQPVLTAIVMQQGDVAFPAAGSVRWIDVRPIFGGVSGSTQAVDHSVYVLTNGTRKLTGDWVTNGFDITVDSIIPVVDVQATAYNAGDASVTFQCNSADNETLAISNAGAADFNVTMDGTLGLDGKLTIGSNGADITGDIAANNDVLIGDTVTTIDVANTLQTSINTANNSIQHFGFGTGFRPILYLASANGTAGSPSAKANGNEIGRLASRTYLGGVSGWKSRASIGFELDGAIVDATGTAPSAVVLYAGTTAQTERVNLGSDGDFHIVTGDLIVDAGDADINQSLTVGTGVTITAGGLTVTAGGITVTAGDIDTTDGSVDLGTGFIEFDERGADPAIAANKAILYAKDDGSGNTRLYYRNNTDGIVEIEVVGHSH